MLAHLCASARCILRQMVTDTERVSIPETLYLSAYQKHHPGHYLSPAPFSVKNFFQLNELLGSLLLALELVWGGHFVKKREAAQSITKSAESGVRVLGSDPGSASTRHHCWGRIGIQSRAK